VQVLPAHALLLFGQAILLTRPLPIFHHITEFSDIIKNPSSPERAFKHSLRLIAVGLSKGCAAMFVMQGLL
jgi:hypothetical protein